MQKLPSRLIFILVISVLNIISLTDFFSTLQNKMQTFISNFVSKDLYWRNGLSFWVKTKMQHCWLGEWADQGETAQTQVARVSKTSFIIQTNNEFQIQIHKNQKYSTLFLHTSFSLEYRGHTRFSKLGQKLLKSKIIILRKKYVPNPQNILPKQAGTKLPTKFLPISHKKFSKDFSILNFIDKQSSFLIFCIVFQIIINENIKNIIQKTLLYINKFLSMINLIDQHGKFNESLREFPNSVGNIAIFGSQSSGKSTLVNAAFGTHFPVLNTLEDRKRCTKGVWIENNGRFNIIDTEGFDSVERANEQRIIQRQIALFCLAVADVIIINLWMNEVGRYQGGQVHILKSIIKAANYLIQQQTKTLLFVVKDCTKDASHQILKHEIENTFNRIIREDTSNKPKTLKFNLEYYFMSHYIYHREDYSKQCGKLASIIKIKKSNLNAYEPKDKIVYLQHLWDTIVANDGQIDLRVEQQALRVFVINRIRNEVKSDVEQLVLKQTRIGRWNSYERFYEHFVRKSFQQIKARVPAHIDEKTMKQQFFVLEEQLQYVIQKHFTEVILPNQQQYILQEQLEKELKRASNSIQLQKIINELRKKTLQFYKLLLKGHKQSPILIKRFAERITQNSVSYERQVSHLFNVFETKLQIQINQQLDRQLKKLKFNGARITQKFKTLCKQFSYNEWEVNTKQIWEKVSHRILDQRLIHKIQDISSSVNYSIFVGGKEAQIIAQHKDLQQKTEVFVTNLLQYFQKQDSQQQYIERAKQKIREGLEAALTRERKRFHLSMLMIGIFLIFCYGQYTIFLKFLGFKKKTRRTLTYFYVIVVGIMVAGSVIKRVLQNSQFKDTIGAK